MGRNNIPVVVQRLLARLLEVPVGRLEEHLVGLLVVAGAYGAGRHRTLVLSFRQRLPHELDLKFLHGWRIPMPADRLDRSATTRRQTKRERFLGLVQRRISPVRCFVVQFLEMRLFIQVLLEEVMSGRVIKNFPRLVCDDGRPA